TQNMDLQDQRPLDDWNDARRSTSRMAPTPPLLLAGEGWVREAQLAVHSNEAGNHSRQDQKRPHPPLRGTFSRKREKGLAGSGWPTRCITPPDSPARSPP